MKHWKKIVIVVVGYEVVAYVYNNYIASSGGFQLPLDGLSQVL